MLATGPCNGESVMALPYCPDTTSNYVRRPEGLVCMGLALFSSSLKKTGLNENELHLTFKYILSTCKMDQNDPALSSALSQRIRVDLLPSVLWSTMHLKDSGRRIYLG